MFRLLFIFTLLIGSINFKVHAVDPRLPSLTSSLMENNNAFTFSLYPTLESQDSDLVYSPLSIFSCLSMVSIGAHGETFDQLQQTLHLQFSREDIPNAFAEFRSAFNDPRLHIANAVWAHQDTFFLPEFLDSLATDFNADAVEINFGNPENAASTINEWIHDRTEGHIPKLIGPSVLSDSTRLVLTNAIYFKGAWSSPFMEGATKNRPFFVSPEKEVMVPTMLQTNSFPYFEDEHNQVLALPFEKKRQDQMRLACVIVLPKEGKGLSLTPQDYSYYLDKLHRRRVEVELPKFKVRQNFDLTDVLKRLGATLPFSSEADFSNMDGLQDLFLSQVIHEAYVSLDESGMTAAAATAAIMNLTSTAHRPPPPPILFKANRPFLFLLVDLSSQGILFLGKVNQPKI